MTRLEPVHPGEVLKHDFMEPFGLSATALAKAIGVTPARINEIVRGRRGITAETALRLARYFNTDARSWMNLQDRYELGNCRAGQVRRPARHPSARRGVRRRNPPVSETRYASAQPSLWAQNVFTSKIVWTKSHWPSRFTSLSS